MTDQTIKMYHGGKRWHFAPTEIQPSKKNRYEGGVGIYFTNSYNTARQYAKGSRVVHLVDIDKNYRDIRSVQLPLMDVVNFVKSVSGLKHKKEILVDLVNNAKRTNSNTIYANVLNNLVVNYEAGAGAPGVKIAKFFADNGIDGTMDRKSGDEFWLVIFNPKVIKKISIVDPSKVSGDDYMLPINK